MAKFSPKSMALFQTKTIQATTRLEPKGAALKMYHLNTTAQGFIEALQTLRDDPKGGESLRKHQALQDGESWAGLTGETTEKILTDGVSRNAHETFKSARGTITATMTHSTPRLSPVGASVSIGRYLSGHPVSCYRRPRAKLPPKDIKLILNASAFMRAEDVAKVLSQIVRAAWEYQLQGGIVNVSITYLHRFSDTDSDGYHGAMATIAIPLRNGASLATLASVQAYRALSMTLASTLSPDRSDSLPLIAWDPAGSYRLTGDPVADAKITTTLKIN